MISCAIVYKDNTVHYFIIQKLFVVYNSMCTKDNKFIHSFIKNNALPKHQSSTIGFYPFVLIIINNWGKIHLFLNYNM